MASGGLQEAIDRLYGAALEDFVPERTRAAKELRAAGEKDAAKLLAKLPKPTAASWALNWIAREDPGAVEAWLAAAEELRETSLHAAQAGGDRVRAAMAAHREATATLSAEVGDRARPGGRPLSEAMLDRVRALLQAATADPDLAELLRAGRVTEEPAPGGLLAPAGKRDPGEPPEQAEEEPPQPPPKRRRSRAKRRGSASEAESEPAEALVQEPAEEPEEARTEEPEDEPADEAEPEPAEPEPEPEPEDPAAARRAELEKELRAAEETAARRRAETVERDAEAEAADERLHEARRSLRRAESEAAAALDAVTDAEEAALAAEREVRRLRGLLRRAG